ncbi:aldehyde dehydrogenase family protein [Sphingobium sp.]|uniref:aldehyde dehydrogenase family protein n=1 Tax=Sphingobium sp. TaxID=1912891 RepID=UPI0028BEA73E|nr:aldehyde dehydrogenase family protein [Sphingobium sp.]
MSIDQYADGPIDTLRNLFDDQKRAFAKNPTPSLDQRAERLDAIGGAILRNRKRIHEALRADFSAHPTELADFTEIMSVVSRMQYAKSMLAEWSMADARPLNSFLYGQSKAYVLPQPKGVIGNMIAWNFPFEIGLGPLAEIIAAGNSAIIKPSDQSPASAELMKDILREAIDEDIVAVSPYDLETSRAFSRLPWDHLMYTGNAAIGREVAGEAAKNLVPLTLELGGKNPTIYAPRSINAGSVAATLRVKLAKGGQICINTDYVLVPRNEVGSFVDHARAWFASEAADFVRSGNVTGIINHRHVARLNAMVENACAQGLEVITLGGERGEDRRMPLSLVIDPPLDSQIMQEEIFGPILPIVPYDTIDDAIAFIASRDRPLGVYLFSDDEALKQRILRETISGGVSFNCVLLHGAQANMGFGGSGMSGYGRHHGIEGFREFSNPRAVLDFDEQSPALSILPPYGDIARKIIAELTGDA